MKQQSPALNNRPWRRIVSIALIILVIVGAIYALLDIPARMRFSVANTEIENVQSDVMNPADAKLWNSFMVRAMVFLTVLIVSPTSIVRALHANGLFPYHKGRRATLQRRYSKKKLIRLQQAYAHLAHAIPVRLTERRISSKCM